MKKLSVLVLTLLFSAAVVTAVMAGPGGRNPGMGPGHGMGPCAGPNLNLTAEQAAKIQTLQEAHFKAITPLRNQIFSLRSELRLLWNSADPDRDKILAKHKEIAALEGQLQEKNVHYQLDYRNVLTPEQKAQMAVAGPGMGGGRCPGGKHGGRW